MVHDTAMPLTPGERIARIRESATLLDKQDWTDIDLILGQHNLQTMNEWSGSKAGYVIEIIKNAADDRLTELHQYLVAETTEQLPVRSLWTGTKLRVFFSHSAQHAHYVASTREALAAYGVEPFVAHDAIEPSAEWALVVESALANCDALVAFLHPEFRQSLWCDHEVGWVLGRKRPVLPLSFGLNPYGLLGKYQAQPCGVANPYQVALFIMDWLIKTPSLHTRVASGLVDAFVNSHGWSFTRSVVPLLERIGSVTDDDLSRMEQAARQNIEISQCVVPPNSTGPEWVARFVSERRGPTTAPTWPVAGEAPF